MFIRFAYFLFVQVGVCSFPWSIYTQSWVHILDNLHTLFINKTILTNICYLYFSISDFNMQNFLHFYILEILYFYILRNSLQTQFTSPSSLFAVAYQSFHIAFNRPGSVHPRSLQMLSPILTFSPFTSSYQPLQRYVCPSYFYNSVPISLP